MGQKAGYVASSLAAAGGVSLAEKVAGKFGREGLALLRGAREAVTGFRIGGRTFKEVAVIGRLRPGGTLYRIGEKGSLFFNKVSWKLAENLKWVDDLIERGVPVELVSPLTHDNLYTEAGNLTPFGAEYFRFKNAGYQDLFSNGRHYLVPR